MVDVKILCGSAADTFVVVDGVRIARRGYPGTSQAGSWVSLEPGWEVVDDGRPEHNRHQTQRRQRQLTGAG
jgi:hypothetical protein